MTSPAPIVNIIRPQLTPEEREARMEELKRAVAKFMYNVEKIRKAKGEQNASSDHV